MYPLGPSVALSDPQWPSRTHSDPQWPSVALSDPRLPSVTLSCPRSPSATHGCPQSSVRALSCPWEPSGALTGTCGLPRASAGPTEAGLPECHFLQYTAATLQYNFWNFSNITVLYCKWVLQYWQYTARSTTQYYKSTFAVHRVLQKSICSTV